MIGVESISASAFSSRVERLGEVIEVQNGEHVIELTAIPAYDQDSYATYVGGPLWDHLTTLLSLFRAYAQSESKRDSAPSRLISPLGRRSTIAMTPERVPWHQMAGILGVVIQIKRNRPPRSERISSGRKTALQTVAAWTPGQNERTKPASSPKADVCYPIWPTPLGIAGNRGVGLDPPKRPTSSAGQTPPKDFDSHDQNCARNGRLDFSAY